jgi:hypothetical protein
VSTILDKNGISIVRDRQSVFNAVEQEDPNSVTYYDYSTDKIIKGSSNEHGLLPSRHPSDVMCDMKEYFIQKDRYEKGQISYDQFITRPFRQEFQDSAYKYFTAVQEIKHKPDNNLLEASNVTDTLQTINERDNIFEAAEINADHFASLKTASIQQILVAIDTRQHNLDQLITTITSNTLNDYEIMIWGKNDKLVTRDVGFDGIPSGILPPKYTTRSIGNQLNGTLATFNGNVAMTAFDVDINAPINRMLAGAIEEDKQKMIAETLNSAAIFEETITVDWDTLNASNTRPEAKAHFDIEARIQAIADQFLGEDVGLFSDRATRYLYDDNQAGWNNSNNMLVTSAGQDVELKKNRVDTNAPRLAGYPWVIDNLATANTLTLVEKRAIYMNQGPRRMSSITHPVLRTYGTVTLEFYKTSLMFPELARRLTSLT